MVDTNLSLGKKERKKDLKKGKKYSVPRVERNSNAYIRNLINCCYIDKDVIYYIKDQLNNIWKLIWVPIKLSSEELPK